ncbi:MAG: MFS transporter [Erysipelotrichaceae bacterium]|nr:MFS transporter [Erysipelotrichaceae bacterium]
MRLTGHKLSSLRKMCLMNYFISISLYFPIEVAYLNSLGFSGIQITMINLCLPLFIGILEIPTGHLGDIKSRKTIMVYAILSFILSLVILLSFRNFFMIFIAYFLEGLGWSLASGNNDALLKDVMNSDVEGFNKGLSKFYEFSFLATLSSSILLVTMTSLGYDDFKLLLVITLIIRVLALVFGLSVTAQNRKQEDCKKHVLSISEATKKYIKNKTTIAIAVYEGIGRFQFFFPTIYQIVLIVNGFPIKYIAYINFGYVVLQYFIQKYSQRIIKAFTRKQLLYILPLIQSLLMLSVFTDNIFILSISIILIYACIPLKTQIANEYKHIYIDDYNRSTYISIVSFIALTFSTIAFFIVGITFNFSNFLGKVVFIALIVFFSLITVKRIVVLDSKFDELKDEKS